MDGISNTVHPGFVSEIPSTLVVARLERRRRSPSTAVLRPSLATFPATPAALQSAPIFHAAKGGQTPTAPGCRRERPAASSALRRAATRHSAVAFRPHTRRPPPSLFLFCVTRVPHVAIDCDRPTAAKLPMARACSRWRELARVSCLAPWRHPPCCRAGVSSVLKIRKA